MEQLVNFVIRPPRADYAPSVDLLGPHFAVKGRRYRRVDLTVVNSRGHMLACSHYKPHTVPEGLQLPCVIYCHGNSGCRCDASEAACVLLPNNITVFAFDFSGSGKSEGDYVSLGWYERQDLKSVIDYLRLEGKTSTIGLWGRSMGAHTCLAYGATDPSIAGMVVDSPFSKLNDLMMELTDMYRIRVPRSMVRMAVQYMRKVIQKKAGFDIMELDVLKTAPSTFIPVLFGHAHGDVFILPHHSDDICKAYAGDKNVIKFEGDHNSPRPRFYYDSISIFFLNVLQPPDLPGASLSDLNSYEGLLDLPFEEQAALYELLGNPTAAPTAPAQASATVEKQVAAATALGLGEALGGAERGGPGGETLEDTLNQTGSRWRMTQTLVPSFSDSSGSEYEDDPEMAEFMRVQGEGGALGFAPSPFTETAEEQMLAAAMAASLADVQLSEKCPDEGGKGQGQVLDQSEERTKEKTEALDHSKDKPTDRGG